MNANHFPDQLSAAAFLYDEEASHLILSNIQDSFVLMNVQMEVVYCNRSALEGIRNFVGIDVAPGVCLMELVSEDRKEMVRQICAEVLLGKKHLTENCFTQADGSTVYFENSFLPAFNDDGCVAGIIFSSKNITERKKAQQAIQESEARLQFALEATQQGAWDWDLTSNEVIYSSSYKKLYGFSDTDLKNHVSDWLTRIHPDDVKKVQQSVKEHLQAPDPVQDSQYRIQAKDGQYRWVAAKGLLLYHEETGRPTRMIGTHTDITEKMDREHKLKQMNERFDCVLKATHELVWEWDIASDKTFRSEDALRKVFGVADNRTIEKQEDWFRRIHPEDRIKVKSILQDTLQALHQQTFELEYRFRRDDGSYAFVYDRGILLKDEQNKPVRIIGSAQDISERKRLERELLENELQYQRLIHQASIDSQERERAEIGKELHDNINQVLTTTKLYLDLALTNSTLREELVAKSMKSIGNVIQEIRHLSRSLMDPSIGDLGLLDSIHDLIESIHQTKKLQVRFAADDEVEDCLDAAQKLTIFRIVQESVNNVLRHAKASHVFITISIHENCLHLVFEDNGIGFRKDSVKKGVGLKNIQNRIYLINGTLQLETQPGNGCKLLIQFPLTKNN